MTVTPPYTDVTRVRALVSRDANATDGTAGSVTETTIMEQIDSAKTMIDARLGSLYVVPFNPVPDLIRDIATALAAWGSDLTFREVRDYQSELNPVLLRYKWATDMLVDLAKGSAIIPGYQPPDPDPGIPDNPNDTGSVVGIFNPNLCATDLGQRRRPSWEDTYYGWTL